TFFIPLTDKTMPLLTKIAKELGTSFTGAKTAPSKDVVTLKKVRIGLWDSNGGSMPSGWTRWILEKFDYDYKKIFSFDDPKLGEYADVMFFNSPTFKMPADADKKGLKRVAWFDSKTPLQSGWAIGQDKLENGVAIVDARIGDGHLVMFGPQILFRGEPHGTFKL